MITTKKLEVARKQFAEQQSCAQVFYPISLRHKGEFYGSRHRTIQMVLMVESLLVFDTNGIELVLQNC